MITGLLVVDKNDNIYFSVSPRFDEYVDFIKKVTADCIVVMGKRMLELCKARHWFAGDASDIYIANELSSVLHIQPFRPKIVMGNDLVMSHLGLIECLLIIKMEQEEERQCPPIRLVYNEEKTGIIGNGFGYKIMTYDISASSGNTVSTCPSPYKSNGIQYD